jgi:hypothetical protein
LQTGVADDEDLAVTTALIAPAQAGSYQIISGVAADSIKLVISEGD